MCGGLNAPPRTPIAKRPPYSRIWPLPRSTYLNVVSSRSPIGPRACSFCVELPISAPIPNSKPSVNRVEAFTYTHAASTPLVNASAASSDDVTIASECPVPCRLTWSTASSSDVDDADRHLQAQVLRVPVRVDRLAHGLVARRRRVRSSPTSSTLASPSSLVRPRQQRVRDRGVDQQRLGRVADARALSTFAL